ncbi:hypothetical protein KEM52_004743 [Ascosphaera acerosa]|nr:hypothetical protein KEM52_004743 [Ascosphaera acerosa]
MNSKYSKFWQCRQDANVPVSVGNDAFSGDSTIGFESPVLSADFYYGPQDPFFRQKYHNLTMGIELSKPELGPGLYFETEIDKLIIVPASMISASESSDSSDSSSSQKSLAYRDSSARNAAWVGQESRVGDKPWFCWWNSTVYEFFIFLNDTAPDDALPTRTTSAVATTLI